MSVLTEVLKLFKYDPATDGDMTFNIGQCMNDNWDKLDAAILLAIAAAGAYNPEESYAVGDYCTYKGKLRKCSTAIPTGETWTEAHWTTTTVAAEMQELSSQLSNAAKAKKLANGYDIKTLTEPGLYMVISPTNAPSDVDSWHAIEVNYSEENYYLKAYVFGTQREYSCRRRYNEDWSEWTLTATATPPQVFDLPLAEEMQPLPNYGSNKYWKNQLNEVTLTISVTKTDIYTNDIDNGSVICYLPAGFRPAQPVGGSAYALQYVETKLPAFIVVKPDGSVRIFQAQEVKCSMVVASISFVAAT